MKIKIGGRGGVCVCALFGAMLNEDSACTAFNLMGNTVPQLQTDFFSYSINLRGIEQTA
jgi:hypothetical protein